MNATRNVRSRFASLEHFATPSTAYKLAPFRFTRIPGIEGEVLIVNELGEYHFLDQSTFTRLHQGGLTPREEVFRDLRSKHFLLDDHADAYWPYAVSQYRTRKAFVTEGPALHIIVPTLRCHHSCPYCQVSRQEVNANRFDLSHEDAMHAITRIFESPSRDLKIEFQGGEPLLAFDRICEIVREVERRNANAARSIEFVIATTLNDVTTEQLEYCRAHRMTLSTSLDGPEQLHNRNRPRRGRDSHQRTLAGIEKARAILGQDGVSALVTVTRESLRHPEAIVDEYARLGFRSIFLRSLSPYGFALRSPLRLGYTVPEFLEFYDRALAHIIRLNERGIYLEEAYTTLLLQHILTPFATGYVDLRSPSGAMLGTLVYNYDGGVYASDEGRMLAENGDLRFHLGSVKQVYSELLNGPAARTLLEASVAESLPGCSDCAFLPYCGADPVYHAATQDDLVGHRPTSAFCHRQTALFQRLFRLLRHGSSAKLRIVLGWLTERAPLAHAIKAGGH